MISNFSSGIAGAPAGARALFRNHRRWRNAIRTGCSAMLALGLAACGGGSADSDIRVRQPAPPTAEQADVAFGGHGHYRGTASDGTENYIVEALISADKLVHVTIFGPNNGSSVNSGGGIWGDDYRPAESLQFVGTIDAIDGREAFGSGHVLGQLCGPSDSGRYCGAPVPASLSLEQLPENNFVAEILVAAEGGDDLWSLEIGKWSLWYPGRASMSLSFDGQERFAPFAHGDDVIVSISAGQLFFQSAASGCIGNGTTSMHGDGRFDVYNIGVEIAACNADFAHLNGEYSGLATFTQNNFWGYDVWMISFLSAPADAAVPVALTMVTGY